MGEIINFPTKYTQDKQSWERFIIDVMILIKKKTLIPSGVEQEISRVMLDVCMEERPKFQFNLEIPPSVSLIDREVIESSFRSTVNNFDTSIVEFSQATLIKRLELEVRLYLCEMDRMKY